MLALLAIVTAADRLRATGSAPPCREGHSPQPPPPVASEPAPAGGLALAAVAVVALAGLASRWRRAG